MRKISELYFCTEILWCLLFNCEGKYLSYANRWKFVILIYHVISALQISPSKVLCFFCCWDFVLRGTFLICWFCHKSVELSCHTWQLWMIEFRHVQPLERSNSEKHCVFYQLRVDCNFSDVTLVYKDNQQNDVHNVILSTAIKLFKTMINEEEKSTFILWFVWGESKSIIGINCWIYYAPPSRPEGPRRCPDRGNAGGALVFSVLLWLLYALGVYT